ncbi:glycoside hydrolase family 2 protein [Kitasatospora sp. NPDC052896]|uniref:glycoside hydrolase family 2 protein n=1 Tax=Kitasatospora sp. NPDC052896 TaxID=3364061 RepID=UPI0037C8BB66
MKQITPLDQGWTLGPAAADRLPAQAPPGLRAGQLVPAEVPGCVHTDLLAAGLIPDPFLDRNELDVAWVGRADWRYDTVLPAPAVGFERTDLVFDGLDTVAEITLRGQRLGSTRNMHRGYRFDVTGLLAEPAREPDPAALTVRLGSAHAEAEAVRAQLGDRPNAYPEPFNHIRKMACAFGWDWGPTLVTAGIWRPARLEHWSTARLARVRPLVTVDADGTGRVELHLDLERTPAGAARPLAVRIRVGGTAREEVVQEAAVASGALATTVAVTVPRPDLWWPRGYGEQPLYDCEIVLSDAVDATPLDSWRRRIGFRTVRLDTSADPHGTAFTLLLNGERLFARGVNWIPDDVFPSRVTRERYRHRLRQAAEAGVNLVRVWGGGIYESEEFYDACDELGLLVWQDFPFACAAYPEEQPLRGEVAAEARENVVRLAPHPSLVLWNGNNENLWGFRDWQWEPRLAGDSWGEGYYLGLLPRITAELDPTRPYWAGSPWSGSWAHHPNDPAHGTHHSWEVWNGRDYTDYLGQVPRFVAEFGWQAPPAYATLRRALSDDPPAADSPGMLHHQKATDGNAKLARGLERHFAPAATFDEWHYLTQLNQARAVATGIAHWRSHWPRCAGTVLWQLNDCWPVTSWAAVDGDGRPKPLLHELRRLYADRLLTFQQRDGLTVLAIDNQSAEPWSCAARVRRLRADGGMVAEELLSVVAPARTVAVLPLPEWLTAFADPTGELLCVDTETDGMDGLRDIRLGCPDREFGYPPGRGELTLLPATAEGEVRLRFTARTLVRDLLVQADRLGPRAVVDRGLLTLLPGESAVFTVRGLDRAERAALTPERLAAALFSVNRVRSTVC